MTFSSIQQTKQALRAELKEKLRKICMSERARASHAAAERLMASAAWQNSATILLYASLDSELDTKPLIEAAWKSGRRVALIRIADQNLHFDLRLFSHENELEMGLWNVRQPSAATPILSMDEVDLIVAPGLGFDRACNRLGRGAGLYDRLLAQKKESTSVIGYFYSFQEVERVPTEPHDQRLTGIVTENKLLALKLTN